MLELAEDRSLNPSQIVVNEEPPFFLIGVQEGDQGFTLELAVLVLGIYILWLRGQGQLNERFRRQIAERPHFILQNLSRLGLSYLLISLLLGFFPPTKGIAEGLRGQIKDLGFSFAHGVVQASHRGRIRIPGFYQEWALPTARLACHPAIPCRRGCCLPLHPQRQHRAEALSQRPQPIKRSALSGAGFSSSPAAR